MKKLAFSGDGWWSEEDITTAVGVGNAKGYVGIRVCFMKLGYPEQHLNNPLFIFIVNIKSQAEINEKWLKLFSMKDKAQQLTLK